MWGHGGRRAFVAMLVLLAVSICAPVQARLHLVKPGALPELEAGEGLLVVGVDTDMPLYRVKVRKDGAYFGGGDLRNLPKGRSLRLYALPAGRYEWAQLNPHALLYYNLRDDAEYEFVVEAGKVNYAGDLQFRGMVSAQGGLHVANRSLGVIDWLKQEHPGVYAAHRLAYTGHYPDPFPAFYRDVVQAAGREPAVDARLAPPPAPAALPLPVRTLWKDDRVLSARINAAGTLAALHLHVSEKRWDVALVDLVAGTSITLATGDTAFGDIAWGNDQVLLVPVREAGVEQVHLTWIGEPVDGRRSFQRATLARKGVVVDTLPGDERHILFASVADRGEYVVHRLDIGSPESLDKRFALRTRVNTGLEKAYQWFTDGSGRVRMALEMREGRRASADAANGDAGDPPPRRVLLYGAEGAYTEVMEIDDDEPFVPEGLSADGRVVYGITEKDRAQRELVALDPLTGKVVRTIFGKSGIDVVSAIFDAGRNVVGVRYYQGGILVSEYFDAPAIARARLLRDAFPARTVMIGDRSRDGGQMLLWVEAADQPAQLYHLDLGARRASLLEETKPGLASSALSPSTAFSFKGADGTPLEAFLTTPRTPGPHPLVVFPHGGPIGVSDTLHFDPEVQFIASLGYAVLRVNFRGSDGYGKAFREMGHRNQGAAIEDDIDAAIRHALAHYPLDATRMCAVGSSYGGYSSLMLSIRWPGRFRCAVTMAGVSDRILFFTASDSARSREVRERMEKTIGNPHTDLAAMERLSPIYQYRELKVPVMIAHGMEDMRVDPEHARRLQRMLEIDGRAPVGLYFDGEGHGLERIENIEAMWNGVAGFLQKHLGPATGG